MPTSRRPSCTRACSPRARKPTRRGRTSAERGITPEAIATFGIGYAPGYADFLLRRLSQARDLSPEILLEAGLATRGDDGTVRDRFRGRLIFPIHDLQGHGIGFGARILPSDPRAGEQAKYLNTAETPIYKKHEVLYNLHRARTAIAKSGEVFVVEGYTDVIAFSQAGIEQHGRHVRHRVGGGALPSALAVRAARHHGVRLRRGGRAGGRAGGRVPGALPVGARRS